MRVERFNYPVLSVVLLTHNRLYAGDQHAYRAYQRYVKNKQLRAEGVFVRPIRYENKSDPRNVEIWQEWDPFPAWKYQSSR